MAKEATPSTSLTGQVKDEVSMTFTVDEFWGNVSNASDPWTIAPLPDSFRKVPWLQLSIMIIVLVFGVMANLSIVFIVLKNKRLRSTPNIIVVNLTVGDLLCLVVNLPFIIDYHLRIDMNWVFGEFMCKFAHSSMVASGCITVYSLMALAIERYLAIAWPWRNRESSRCVRVSRSCFLSPTWQIVLMIWLGAFLVGAPIWYTAEVYVYPDGVSLCTFINPGGKIAPFFKVFRLMVAYAIPLAIIVLTHTLTARALLKSIREPVTGETAGNRHDRQSPRVRSRVKLAIVISVLSAMFFIAWLPFYMFSVWYQFHFSNIFETYAMLQFLRWKDIPVYILSCLNPIMLYVLSTRFREKLVSDIFCFCRNQTFQWKPAETFSSLKGSFLTTSTFRSGSTCAGKSSSDRNEQGIASSGDL